MAIQLLGFFFVFIQLCVYQVKILYLQLVRNDTPIAFVLLLNVHFVLLFKKIIKIPGPLFNSKQKVNPT